MNYYETLYIVHPALESGRLKEIIMDVEDSLKKLGGSSLAIELWGKRKLAYFIDKQKYGTYVLVQYNGEGKCTRDFAVELEHNPNILAYLTTNINQDNVIEQEEDLETQIAGKTREAERKDVNIKRKVARDSTILVNEKLKDNIAEVKKDEKASGDGDGQTNSQTDDIKDHDSESVLSDDDKHVDVVAESKTIKESESVEENPAEETVLESDQEKANESNTISEKE